MSNLYDVKWLLRCQTQLRDMADDPKEAKKIVEALDADPALRDELSHLYVRALSTGERSRRQESLEQPPQ